MYVQKPRKLKDYFLAPFTSKDGKHATLKISGCIWNTMHVFDHGNACARIWISDQYSIDELDTLRAYDDIVYQQTIQKNGSWFSNSLTAQQMQDYFRPSVHAIYNTIGVLISHWKQPLIYVDGVLQEVFDLSSIKKDTEVDVEIESEGVCFFPQRFGLRWMLKRLWIRTIVAESVEDAVGLAEDRAIIHEGWKDDIKGFQEKLEKEKSILQEKMDRLDKLAQDIEKLWIDSKNLPDDLWNLEMKKVASMIYKCSKEDSL